MLKFRAQKNGPALPEAFQNRGFRSYVDMANFADEHGLPNGKYWIVNDQGANLLTYLRQLTYHNGRFHVEGRGNV